MVRQVPGVLQTPGMEVRLAPGNDKRQRFAPEVVVRQKRTKKPEEKTTDVEINLRVASSMKPVKRLTWLTHACKMLSDGRTTSNELFSIVTSRRFASGVSKSLGKSMVDIVNEVIFSFSEKQQRHFQSDAWVLHNFRGGDDDDDDDDNADAGDADEGVRDDDADEEVRDDDLDGLTSKEKERIADLRRRVAEGRRAAASEQRDADRPTAAKVEDERSEMVARLHELRAREEEEGRNERRRSSRQEEGKDDEQARREALERRLNLEEQERRRKREERERRLAAEAEAAEARARKQNTQQVVDDPLELLERLTQRPEPEPSRPRRRAGGGRRDRSRSISVQAASRSRSRRQRPNAAPLSFEEALARRIRQREQSDSTRIPVTWSREELRARNYRV